MTALFSSPCEFCALWDQKPQSFLLDSSLLCCCLRPQGRALSLSAARKILHLPGFGPPRRIAGNGIRSW